MLDLLRWGDAGWGDELARGLGVTLALALITAPLAIVLSFFIAWGRQSRHKPVRLMAQAYVTVFRSLPEILTLLIIYFQLQALINWLARLLWAEARIDLNAFAAGVVALTLVFSALGSEVVRGAYNAVARGQFEAAAALGMRRPLSFFKIVLPQMWRHCIPGFGNLWLILLKDTSLVSIIAVNDIVRYTNMAIATTKQPFFFYIVLAAVFLVLTLISGAVQGVFEKQASQRFAGRA